MKRSAPAAAVEDNEESKRARIKAPSYRGVPPDDVIADIRPSKSKFGGSSLSFKKLGGAPVTVTTPWMKLKHDPEPWDEQKQAKYGKEKDKPLDPERKSDKWNFDAELPSNDEEKNLFMMYVDGVRLATAKAIFENRDKVWPTDKSKQRELKGPESVVSSYESTFKWEDGRDYFKPDISAPAHSKSLTLPIVSRDTGKFIDVSAIGKGTEVAFIIDFSSAYVGKSVKLYATPIQIAVRNVVARASRNPDDYEGEWDE